jgi:hypothetical protein
VTTTPDDIELRRDRATAEFNARQLSQAPAFILFFFFGGLGGHRFYLGMHRSAAAMLVGTMAAYALAAFVHSVFALGIIVLVIWTFIDLFRIPELVRYANEARRAKILVQHGLPAPARVSPPVPAGYPGYVPPPTR